MEEKALLNLALAFDVKYEKLTFSKDSAETKDLSHYTIRIKNKRPQDTPFYFFNEFDFSMFLSDRR